MRASFFDIRVRLPLYWIILTSLAVITTLLIYWYFRTQDEKWLGLLGGTATGLVVAIVQLLLELHEHRHASMLRNLRIQRVLPHREGREYYGPLIRRTKHRISMLGNTGSRFLEDFANVGRSDKKELLEALSRGVQVQLLVPNAAVLKPEMKFLAEAAQKQMQELQKQFPEKFEARLLPAQPFHSVLRLDDECLIGPIFPDVKTQDTPTIHTYGNSDLAKRYLDFFEHEWRSAERL